MSISASSVTLAAWPSSWWGFPAEAVKVYSLSYSSLGCRVAIQLSPTASPSRFPEVRAGLADRPAPLDPALGR